MITSMPGIGSSSGPSSWPPPEAAWPSSVLLTALPASVASHPFPATPARSVATSAAHGATTADSNASSTSPRCSASATATSPAGFTTQASRGKTPRPGSSGLGPPGRQRPPGPPPRQTALPDPATHSSRSLTDGIRVHGANASMDRTLWCCRLTRKATDRNAVRQVHPEHPSSCGRGTRKDPGEGRVMAPVPVRAPGRGPAHAGQSIRQWPWPPWPTIVHGRIRSSSSCSRMWQWWMYVAGSLVPLPGMDAIVAVGGVNSWMMILVTVSG